ncbi:MAG: protein-glutamate O-methyltransferase CheR [Clostridiales Family XIII bacterium]|jgi:chemotaxis protein methyltransferase CheR|nr:protein-glutamate O-methyltransferase CheR [Clostridiales Family XIII bacterium]
MITLSEKELADISGYIKEHYGVNLAAKSSLIEGRLGCYVMSRGFASYGDYFEFAKRDPTQQEMTSLINRLTTNHTFFMRESDHFDFFSGVVLPWIARSGDKDMRVWCAGCATGEEPYALSIYILEYLETQASAYGWDSVVLASDISEQALKTASNGLYSAENLSSVSDGRKLKYFTETAEGNYRVTPGLRKNVAFRKINLLDPFHFSKPFQTVFCRNVMIYFDAETKTKLIDKFFNALVPGGYLFIGHSESLATLSHRFTYVKPSVYRKPE